VLITVAMAWRSAGCQGRIVKFRYLSNKIPQILC
jgi:hypothetical protein